MKQFSKELGKVSITPKGDWDSSIANEKLDIVYDRRNNQAYIAKQDVPIGVDIDNREYWQPLNVSGYADNNFINLTAENENGTITAYESLEEAVATIFPINRRVGATLSFYNLNSDRLDRQAEFELWQFNSTDLANWENKDYWNNIYYNWNVFAGWYIDADALTNHVEIPNVGQYAYVGSNLNDAILYQCRTNGTWTNTGIKVRNYISVVVSGNITIGDNGNWFSDGKDTGIPATPAVDEQLDNIINKHESLSRTVQGIAATGGASTATNVTYNNDASGLNAENAQDAIDELQGSKIDKTSILQELGEAENKIMSQKAVKTELDKKANKADMVVELAKKANTEDVDVKLDKKFDKESVANLADDEDITSVDNGTGSSVLKFADRTYNANNFSGKGYKILRKNIQSVNIASTKITITEIPSSDGTLSFTINDKETQIDVSASTDNTTALVAQKVASALQDSMIEYDISIDASLITLTRKSSGSVTPSVFSANTTGIVCTITDSTKREFRNILISNMINQPNTIYEIRYDFDLNGETVNVPENCTLKFEGGSLGNGTINGNDTTFIDSANTYIFKNINLYHLAQKEFSVEWFGASSKKEDNQIYINEAINQVSNCQGGVIILSTDYTITDTIFIKRFVSIKGIQHHSINYLYKGNNSSAIKVKFDNPKKWAIDYKCNNEAIQYNKLYIDDSIIDKNSILLDGTYLENFDIFNINNIPVYGGIRLRRVHNSYIKNVNIERFKYCMDLSYCWNITISDMRMQPTYCGIYMSNVTQINYVDVYVLNAVHNGGSYNPKEYNFDEPIYMDKSKLFPPYGEYNSIAFLFEKSSATFTGLVAQQLDAVLFATRGVIRILSEYLELIKTTYFWVANNSYLYAPQSDNKEYIIGSYCFGGDDNSVIYAEGFSEAKCYPDTKCYYNIRCETRTVLYYDNYEIDDIDYSPKNTKIAPNKSYQLNSNSLFYRELPSKKPSLDIYNPFLRLGDYNNDTTLSEILKRTSSLYNNKDVYQVVSGYNNYNYDGIVTNKTLTFKDGSKFEYSNLHKLGNTIKCANCNFHYETHLYINCDYAFDLYGDCVFTFDKSLYKVNHETEVLPMFNISKDDILLKLYLSEGLLNKYINNYSAIIKNKDKRFTLEIYNLNGQLINKVNNTYKENNVILSYSDTYIKVSLTNNFSRFTLQLFNTELFEVISFAATISNNKIYIQNTNQVTNSLEIYKDETNKELYIKNAMRNNMVMYYNNCTAVLVDNIPDSLKMEKIAVFGGIYNNNKYADGQYKYSKSYKKPLYNIDGNFYDANGNIYDALTKGNTSQRPLNVSFGFIYKNTDTGKWEIFNGSSWENLDGTELTATNSNDQGAENP